MPTVRVTGASSTAMVPTAGICASTCPTCEASVTSTYTGVPSVRLLSLSRATASSCERPVRSGTMVLPPEMVNSALWPEMKLSPALGLCPRTVPTGEDDTVLISTMLPKPRSFSRAAASS